MRCEVDVMVGDVDWEARVRDNVRDVVTAWVGVGDAVCGDVKVRVGVRAGVRVGLGVRDTEREGERDSVRVTATVRVGVG